MGLVEDIRQLGDKLGTAQALVHELAQISPARLKLYGDLLEKIKSIADAQGAQGPQTIQSVVEIVRLLNATPVEKVSEIRKLVADLEKLSSSMPKELLALAQAALAGTKK
jgi:hypothetical protein